LNILKTFTRYLWVGGVIQFVGINFRKNIREIFTTRGKLNFCFNPFVTTNQSHSSLSILSTGLGTYSIFQMILLGLDSGSGSGSGSDLKGTVQRKLTGVKIGINQ
jgi:Na+-translocating ferredoxin:NAD+ oxidoreductase RnfA subunit